MPPLVHDTAMGINVVTLAHEPRTHELFASVYVRFITGIDVRDSTAGFMCYKRKVLETVRLEKIKFGGLCLPERNELHQYQHGFKLVEVPVSSPIVRWHLQNVDRIIQGSFFLG